jgi:DNA modification methylase
MLDIKTLCGDCIEVMGSLEPNSIDTVICDPPYGMTANKWDSIIPFDLMWKELLRITKNDSAIIFTCSQPFTSALIMSNPAMYRHEWIWHKNRASGHLNSSRMPLKAHENIIVFGKQVPRYFPQMTHGHKPVSSFYTRNNGHNYGDGNDAEGGGSTSRFPRSVVEYKVVDNIGDSRLHPTQKPVELMEHLVKSYSSQNDVILDFAMGSGSTGIACKNLDRKFVGIDKDPLIYNKAVERLSQHARH